MLIQANALHIPLADNSVHMVMTSPPYYGLRSYDTGSNKAHELGSEKTPAEYVANMVAVFDEVRRVLRSDGVAVCNIGDSYVGNSTSGGTTPRVGGGTPYRVEGVSYKGGPGLKPKDLCLIPERLAIALQDAGWWVRSRIAWVKRAPMPESVTDRPTSAWEHVWLLAKSERYFWDQEAVREESSGSYNGSTFTNGKTGAAHSNVGQQERIERSGRNMRNVITTSPEPYAEAHFATYPRALVRPFILAGTSAAGCCASCGKPYVRVVEREKHPTRDVEAQRARSAARTGRADGHTEGPSGMLDVTHTVGWRKDCDCFAGWPGPLPKPVPATVLDPFSGSGTTVAVAQELGRRGVGLDLSAAYIELARQRIFKAAIPLFAAGIEA